MPCVLPETFAADLARYGESSTAGIINGTRATAEPPLQCRTKLRFFDRVFGG